MKSTNIEVQWNQLLASIIRDELYQPDGKPPEQWSIGQDLRICKLILARGQVSPRDMESTIRGLRILYPAGKLTLRLLVKDTDWSLRRRASAAYWQTQKRAPMSGKMRDIMRDLAS